jgi:hypothetical protein
VVYFFLAFAPITYKLSSCPSLVYMLWPHPPWLNHSNYTWRKVQVMNIIMQLSPTSCHFFSSRYKYFAQHPVLKHTQSMFLLQCQRPKFRTRTKPKAELLLRSIGLWRRYIVMANHNSRHYSSSCLPIKIGRFGYWILPPATGGKYSVGLNR